MADKLKFYIYIPATLLLILHNTVFAEPAPQSLIQIGFNYPRSGPYAAIGASQYRGAQLAVEEINSLGGILQHQIRLLVKDSGSNVSKTQSNVKSFLDKEKVPMVFGGVSSDVAIAACELCQERWVPFFGTLTYSTATTGEEAHRACFRESYNAWMAAKLLARYMKQNFPGRRYFYITADYTWGWTTEESVRTLTGTADLERHPGVRTRLGTTNFIEPLRRARSANPDVLILILGGNDIVTAVRQATVMGLKDQLQIVVPNMIRNSIVRSGPEAMEGIVGTVPWFWEVPYIYNYPKGKGFVERYKKKYNDFPTSGAASAYTILFEYKAAVERAASFDGPAVIHELEGHTYQSVKDEQMWRDFDHQSIQTVYLVRGRPAREYGRYEIALEHIEILDSMPGHLAARTYEEWLTVRRQANKPATLERMPGEEEK